jgi:hypothetical protein
MKNLAIFLFISIQIFCFGCASLKPERNVVDNVFYSSFPKIKIKIDEDFKYLGDVSKEGDVEGIETTLHGNVTDYPFIVAQKNYVKKALIIKISKTSGYYRLRHPKNIEEKAIEYGSAKIGDNKYLYDIKGASPTLGGYLVKHIYEKGYIMSCGILSRYYRIAGANNYLETIMYYERIPDDSTLNCGTWLNKIYITENHLSYIEEYKKRFESSFEIAGSKTSSETVSPKTTFDSQLALVGSQKLAHNFNPEEPWTGKWRVEGHKSVTGIWILKQSRNNIVSIEDSILKIEGRAVGSQFKGKYKAKYQPNYFYSFKVSISSDGLSFEGTTSGQISYDFGQIRGMRVE